MLARWSLRAKLVAVVTVALLPVLALSAWYSADEQRKTDLRRVQAVASAAELAVSAPSRADRGLAPAAGGGLLR